MQASARKAIEGKGQIEGPIYVCVAFFMPRPKYHYAKDGSVKPRYRYERHVIKPDATKLWRCAEDALKGIWWGDDSQIVSQVVTKRYADSEGPGMWISAE